MNCPKCGAPLDDDSKFCTSCGENVENITMKYCKYCGARIPNNVETCPECGKDVSKQKIPGENSSAISSNENENVTDAEKSNSAEETNNVIEEDNIIEENNICSISETNSETNKEKVEDGDVNNEDTNIWNDIKGKSDKEKGNSKNSRFVKIFIPIVIIVAILAIIAFVVAFTTSSTGEKCEIEDCNKSVVAGYSYCSEHKCSVESCARERLKNSEYCMYHRQYGANATNSTTKSSSGANATNSTTKSSSGTYSGSNSGYVRSSDLKISNIKVSSKSSNYTVAEGTITNKGGRTVKYVKIRGAFEDGDGNVLDTDWTYAVGGEGLGPGESSTWRMSVKRNISIHNCKVTILDYD